MRALRVVGITEGGGELSVVLEDSARQERFTVPADEQLRAAARGDLTRLGQIAIELESQLRPREIQARIRAGASVDQVAAAAGVPSQKIERFAYPVLLERSRTAEVAQRAHPMRADGPDTRMLADVVAHTFGLRGQEYVSAEWDSWKGDDGRWVVALSWRAGRSDNRALWAFQPGAHGGTVTAIDEHAHDLVEGLPARPLRTVGPVIDISRPDEQPPPAPEEGHELRAAASDIAARRDVSDWSRVAPEPRRPESRRPAARPEPGEPHRSGRADEPATDWPAPPRQSESGRQGDTAASADGSDGRRDTPPADRARTDDRPRAGASAEASQPATGPTGTARPDNSPSGTTGATPSGSNGATPSGANSATPSGSNGATPSGANSATPSGSNGVTPSGTAGAGSPGATPAAPTDDRVRPGAASAADRPAGGGDTAATRPDTRVGSSQPEAAVPNARAPQPETAGEPDETAAAAETMADQSPTETPAPRRAEPEATPTQQTTKRGRKGKPVMPSWDEVLLGVRSQR
jgi:hypothetical protein